jgi:hypothetical protein
MLWSPRKVREAQVREMVKQCEEEQQKLQKTHNRKLKVAATIYKKNMAEEVKALRQITREHAAEDRKTRAAELAAARALKKQQRNAATSQISRDTLNKGKQKASQSAALESTKKHCVVSAQSSVDAAPLLPQPAPKITTCGRQIKVLQKFK